MKHQSTLVGLRQHPRKVNVFYLHADKVGNDNSTALQLSGSVTFNTKILGAISKGAMLKNSHSALGSATTTYSTSTDQGIEYGDSVTLMGDNQLNVSFSLWGMGGASTRSEQA